MQRSTLEAYISIIVSILVAVLPMTIWLRVVLMAIAAGLLIDIACRSPWTVSWRSRHKAFLSSFLVVVLAVLVWIALRQPVQSKAAEVASAKPVLSPTIPSGHAREQPKDIPLRPEEKESVKQSTKAANKVAAPAVASAKEAIPPKPMPSSLPPNISAPNGIAIGGGTVLNPTVNNFGKPEKPARRIPPDIQAEMIKAFHVTPPGRINISAAVNNPEAWDFANDFYAVFLSAKWAIGHNRITSFMSSGKPWAGVKLTLEVVAPDAKPGDTIEIKGPSGNLLGILKRVFEYLHLEYRDESTQASVEGVPTLLVGPQ